eukprot:3170911-Prymnesium_polylepis.1
MDARSSSDVGRRFCSRATLADSHPEMTPDNHHTLMLPLPTLMLPLPTLTLPLPNSSQSLSRSPSTSTLHVMFTPAAV